MSDKNTLKTSNAHISELLAACVGGKQVRHNQIVQRTGQPPSWSHPRFGEGNWAYAPNDAPTRIGEIAKGWAETLQGVEFPWLCWCVDDNWCLVQQQLVQNLGWTPVVGSDGAIERPRTIDGAIAIDFAGDLGVVKLRPHFVIEFAFLLAPRLAYWHSDVLLPQQALSVVDRQFRSLTNGQHCGVTEAPTLGTMVRRLFRRQPITWKRIFEVVGCTTRGASLQQYQTGCGIWRHIEYHPHYQSMNIGKHPHWEFGVGIHHWVKHHPESFKELVVDVEPYHFTQINNAAYQRIVDDRDDRRFKGRELSQNFDLTNICEQLGIEISPSLTAAQSEA